MNFTHKKNWKDFMMNKKDRFIELRDKMLRAEKMSISELLEMIESEPEELRGGNDTQRLGRLHKSKK